MADQPDNIISGRPTVKKSGAPIGDIMMAALTETIVDLDATRPGMFVLRFLDSIAPDTPTDVDFKIGDEVEILESGSSKSLIKGEVTSLEVDYGKGGQRTIVRGHDKSHRLHRVRKYRSFVNSSDSDIVSQVVGDVGISAGTVTSTSSVHKILMQVNQTDWEFLKWRAEENGFTLDLSSGSLNFRKPDSDATSAATLSIKDSLIAFRPRMSAPPVASVTVRAWDEKQKQKFENKVGTLPSAKGASLTDTPDALAGKFAPGDHLSAIRSADADGDVSAMASAIADRYADSFVEAEAVSYGNPALLPGANIEVKDAGDTFNGKYRITSAKHVFNSDVRYQTVMRFSGIQDRSLLGLVSNGNGNGNGLTSRTPKIDGVVPAIVTNAKDDEKRGRVKIKFPWLDDSVETEWVRTVQQGAGPSYGAMVVPEVNDEVLVAFEQGDFRRPYIIGSVYNGTDKPLGAISDVVDSGSGKVKLRGYASRLGHTLVFDDADDKSGIHLLTADTNFEIYLDQKNTKITIDAKSGKIEIHGAQDVTVKSDQNINIEATQNLTLKGTAGVSIESSANATVKATGQMEVSGATTAVKGSGTLDLDGGGMASLHAGLVKIN